MDKINKIGYRVLLIITILFLMAVVYGTYYEIKHDMPVSTPILRP